MVYVCSSMCTDVNIVLYIRVSAHLDLHLYSRIFL